MTALVARGSVTPWWVWASPPFLHRQSQCQRATSARHCMACRRAEAAARAVSRTEFPPGFRRRPAWNRRPRVQLQGHVPRPLARIAPSSQHIKPCKSLIAFNLQQHPALFGKHQPFSSVLRIRRHPSFSSLFPSLPAIQQGTPPPWPGPCPQQHWLWLSS